MRLHNMLKTNLDDLQFASDDVAAQKVKILKKLVEKGHKMYDEHHSKLVASSDNQSESDVGSTVPCTPSPFKSFEVRQNIFGTVPTGAMGGFPDSSSSAVLSYPASEALTEAFKESDEEGGLSYFHTLNGAYDNLSPHAKDIYFSRRKCILFHAQNRDLIKTVLKGLDKKDPVRPYLAELDGNHKEEFSELTHILKKYYMLYTVVKGDHEAYDRWYLDQGCHTEGLPLPAKALEQVKTMRSYISGDSNPTTPEAPAKKKEFKAPLRKYYCENCNLHGNHTTKVCNVLGGGVGNLEKYLDSDGNFKLPPNYNALCNKYEADRLAASFHTRTKRRSRSRSHSPSRARSGKSARRGRSPGKERRRFSKERRRSRS